jgi:ATP-dependent DNA ligase
MQPQWSLPMLAAQAKDDVTHSDAIYVAEAKFDGWRAGFYKDREGRLQLFGGRNGNEYTGQIRYLEDAVVEAIPADTFIDGELLSPVGHGGVQSSMTTKYPHRPSAMLPELYLVVFDVLRDAGEDVRHLPWSERRARLEELIDPMLDPKRIKRSIILPANTALEMALSVGLEGVVYKLRSSRYENKRSGNWIKVKPQESLEARVIGFKPGESSFAGMVGAVEFEILETGVRSRASGMTMTVRQDMTDHPERWLGKVVEIRHHGISKDGKPRHPQFYRVRLDRVA